MPIAVYDPCAMVAIVDDELVTGFAGEDQVCVVQTSDSLKFILQITSTSAIELKSKVGKKVNVLLKHKIYPNERESSVDYLDVYDSYLVQDYKAEFTGTKMATITFYFQKETN